MQGLDDVIAADTVLSEVDGKAGRLIIRGRSLDELAGHTRFEDVVRLLWEGFLDPLPDDLAPALGAARHEVFVEIEATGPLPPYDAMRALTARLADGADLATALRLVAAPSVFTAAALRRRAGLAPVTPDAGLGHSADTLRMLSGETPAPARAAALDAYLVTVCDHGLNASTFAARVIASTGAGLVSAALGGLSALKGPLHGGAPGPVIAMLDAIATPDNARPWLEAALARGDRLMGFGHRIYRVRDPRADALHHLEPRHAGEEREPDGEHGDQQQRRAVEAQRLRRAAADDFAEHATGRERQRRGHPPQSRGLDGGTGEDDQREADRDEDERMLALARGIGEQPVGCDDRDHSRHHPPPRRQPEQIKQHVGEPRTEHAAAIGDQRRCAGVRESRVGAIVGCENQREIDDDGDHQQPPRFLHQARGSRRPRLGCLRASVSGRFFAENHDITQATSETTL